MSSGVNAQCRQEILEIDLELSRLCDRRGALEELSVLALGAAHDRKRLDASLEEIERDVSHDPIKRAALHALYQRITPDRTTTPTPQGGQHDDYEDA